MDILNLNKKGWFQTLAYEQRELLKQSLVLLEQIEGSQEKYFDHAFVIMPAAKAYEGFVKDLLFKLNLISEKKYLGTRFRVGKSLNPELDKIPRFKKEALYDELTKIFGDNKVPEKLWQTWRECRNQILHYFPNKLEKVTLSQARKKVEQIIAAIESASIHPRHLNNTEV